MDSKDFNKNIIIKINGEYNIKNNKNYSPSNNSNSVNNTNTPKVETETCTFNSNGFVSVVENSQGERTYYENGRPSYVTDANDNVTKKYNYESEALSKYSVTEGNTTTYYENGRPTTSIDNKTGSTKEVNIYSPNGTLIGTKNTTQVINSNTKPVNVKTSTSIFDNKKYSNRTGVKVGTKNNTPGSKLSPWNRSINNL